MSDWTPAEGRIKLDSNDTILAIGGEPIDDILSRIAKAVGPDREIELVIRRKPIVLKDMKPEKIFFITNDRVRKNG